MPTSNRPLAYHITWGTYGTRLHGDGRGTVWRAQNEFEAPIVGRHDHWERLERTLLRFPPVVLTLEQRRSIEDFFLPLCERGGWHPIAIAAAPDHVHCMVRATQLGREVRRWMKTFVSQCLGKRWPLAKGQSYWAECGSVKWVWTRPYFDRVFKYVNDQRATSTDTHSALSEPGSVTPVFEFLDEDRGHRPRL
jgi:REP element-mobilizing transposase RayT